MMSVMIAWPILCILVDFCLLLSIFVKTACGFYFYLINMVYDLTGLDSIPVERTYFRSTSFPKMDNVQASFVLVCLTTVIVTFFVLYKIDRNRNMRRDHGEW